MEYGVISPPYWFGGLPELYLPLDFSYIKDDKQSKLVKLFLEKIQVFFAVSMHYEKASNTITIGEGLEFVLNKDINGEPVIWDSLKESIVLDEEDRSKYIEKWQAKPNALDERVISMLKRERRRYFIEENCYGLVKKFGFFSQGELELILPLDLSKIKDDPIHQNIRKMLEKMNVFIGFAFDYLNGGNKIILMNMISFGSPAYHGVKWDIASQKFNKVEFDDFILNNGEKLRLMQKASIIYLSYSTLDSNKFSIASIAHKLESLPEIEKMLFWEEDMNDDIIEYMDENIAKCDVFLLFCSQNALNSEPVKMEWQSALKLKKKIIPVFINESDIPPLLSSKLGILFDKNNVDKTKMDLYYLIKRKLQIEL